tara:strand:+ start:106 stop:489 length:384 start_codon:yes stop_codon:yes gene_type:complete
MNFIEKKKIKFLLIVIIFIQLFYISQHKLEFKTEILKNSFLKEFGSKYVMTNDLLELKKVSKDFKLDKFNISTSLKNNTFFNQRSIEYLYPVKLDDSFKKIFYPINEKIPNHCFILNKFEYLIFVQC